MVLRSFIFDFSSKFFTQFFSLIVSLLLTRLLQPAEFGIIGLSLAIISFLSIFVDLGIGRAIIQAKDVTKEQLSTLFFLNLLISLFLAAVLFFSAGMLAGFFKQPLAEPVLKALTLSFLFGALNIVQNGILFRQLKFKSNSIIAIIASLVSGSVSIVLAYKGFGVWSIVIQNILFSFISLLLVFLQVRWLPSFVFRLAGIREMILFSSRLFVSTLLDNVVSRLDVFIIAKLYTPDTLGYYSRAQSLDAAGKQMSGSSIFSVIFPFLSKIQEDTALIRQKYSDYLHSVALLSFFMSGVLFLSAEPAFDLLFTDKWVIAAKLFKILSVSMFVYPISALMVSVLMARGNSKNYLKLEVLKKLLLLPVYFFGFFFGLYGFAWFFTLSFLAALLLNTWFVSREIKFGVGLQLRTIGLYGAIALGSVVICSLLFPLIHRAGYLYIQLAMLVALYTALYFLLNRVVNTTGFNYVLHKLKKLNK